MFRIMNQLTATQQRNKNHFSFKTGNARGACPSVIGLFQSSVFVQRAGPCFCPWSERRHKMRTVESGMLLISTSGSKRQRQIRAYPNRRPCLGRHTVTQGCRISVVYCRLSRWSAFNAFQANHAWATSAAHAGGWHFAQ